VSYKANIAHLEALHNVAITKLRPIDFTNVFFTFKRQGLATATIKACKSAGKQVYDLAISNRIIDYNPAGLAKVPKETDRQTKGKDDRRALTPQEMRWITDTPHRAQTPAMIMLYAGLRRGEVIPLTWDHIDLDKRTIFVEVSVENTEEGLSVKPGGKTECSTRTVDIPTILVDYLRQLTPSCEYVCPSAHNKMMSLTSWRKMWDSYLNVLNFKYGNIENKPTSRFAPDKLPFVIPKITPHWLRHTFITMMYQAGVDVLTAKEQAGHADIQTTLSIYTHLDRTHKRRQMDKLDEYISCQ
jgi:integrase